MSPDRRDIEGSIMRSVKYAAVDGAHKLDPGTTARHARRCVPSLLAFAADVAAMSSDENGEPETALQRAISAADSARRLQAAAEASNDIRARAQAAQAVSKSISTLALLNGEMGADVEAKIAMSAKWSKLKILIAAALKPFPEASKAVGMALREAEAD
jgi:hypothetical protein